MIRSHWQQKIAATTLMATLLGCNGGQPETAQKFVAATQIVEHPSLDATREGIKDELAAAGYKEGENLKWTWESAQGNPATATQIAKKLIGENPDAIVAIATPSAQAIAAATQDLPIIFSAVTDPVGAKLVPNLTEPGSTITGVTDLSPIDKHLDLMVELTPDSKRVGVLYNAGEANSTTLVNLLKQEAPKRGMTLVEATAANSSEVGTAAKSLVGKVDAIYIPTDNTIVSALESVLQVGIANQIPVYAGDTDSVAKGAIAGLGFNYYDVGRQTGKIVVRVLEGENPGAIAVQSVDKLELHINPPAAESMGVTIPPAVEAKADKVVGKDEG